MLKGQRVVVFGASSGVGLATAQTLARHGASVVVTARGKEEIDKAVAAIEGGQARGFAVDGKDEKGVAAFFGEVGEIDHLVIPAGATNRGGDFLDTMTQESFRATFEGKFWVQMNVAHAGGRYVRRGGSITFFSGGAAHRAMKGMVNIAAVNGAIESVVPPLALELGPTRVNAISPGTLATSYWSGMPEEQQRVIFDHAAGLLPAGRVGTAQDIANAVFFLVTTSYVTGTVLHVDGGLPHSNV
jgi:NAD(P)-dependent dehydrogenase (short-subunit alcohol dehydrogenase family)